MKYCQLGVQFILIGLWLCVYACACVSEWAVLALTLSMCVRSYEFYANFCNSILLWLVRQLVRWNFCLSWICRVCIKIDTVMTQTALPHECDTKKMLISNCRQYRICASLSKFIFSKPVTEISNDFFFGVALVSRTPFIST